MNQSLQSSPDSDGQLCTPRHSFLIAKFQEIVDQNPELTLDQAFYLEYCKMYIQTIRLEQEIDSRKKQIVQLRYNLEKVPSRSRRQPPQLSHNQTSNSQKRKRVRRTANEIARHYTCKVENCQKSYGSEGSLNQHMKLKHRQMLDQGGQISEHN